MSSRTPSARPGITGQAVARTTFRALGVLITGAALVLLVVGGIDLFSAFDPSGRPTKLWMFFVAIPLLGMGGWCLQAGFLGVGEPGPGTADAVTGPHCRSCGARNDPAARFCPSCGTPVV